MKKMKRPTSFNLRNFLFQLLLVFTGSCFAQDTIVKKNGQLIIAQVKEVSPTEIKYLKIEMENGPLYIEDRFSVEKIKYRNGFVEVFTTIDPWKMPVKKEEKKTAPIEYVQKPMLERSGHGYSNGTKYLNENQMQKVALSLHDPAINEQVRAARWAKGLQFIGFLAIPIFFAQMGYNVNHMDWDGTQTRTEQNANLAFIGSGALAIGASIHFKIENGKRNKTVVEMYNRHQ